MRVDCRYYDSRTYASGEVVRMCRLDLAPDAPWKCPEDCPKYTKRTFDAGWTVGTFAGRDHPSQPETDDDLAASALLADAEQLINELGPGVVADVERQQAKSAKWRARKKANRDTPKRSKKRRGKS